MLTYTRLLYTNILLNGTSGNFVDLIVILLILGQNNDDADPSKTNGPFWLTAAIS